MVCGVCRNYRTPRSEEMLRHLCRCGDARWARVIELRQAGRDEEAGGMVSRILGVKGPAMTEEAKARILAYRSEHREEIREKRRRKRALRRVLARARTGRPAARART